MSTFYFCLIYNVKIIFSYVCLVGVSQLFQHVIFTFFSPLFFVVFFMLETEELTFVEAYNRTWATQQSCVKPEIKIRAEDKEAMTTGRYEVKKKGSS